MGSKLSIDDLGAVWEAVLDACTKSYEIGLKLNIPVATLDSIRVQFEAPKDKLRETLKVWLKTAAEPKWQDILDALRSFAVEESRLATTVEDKYCTTAESGEQASGQIKSEVQLPQTSTQLIKDYERLLQQLQDSQKQNQQLTHQNQQLTQQVKEKQHTIDTQETQLQQLQDGIDKTVNQLKQELQQAKEEKEVGERQLRQINHLLLQQKQTIGDLRVTNDRLEQHLQQAEQRVKDKECMIGKLQELNQETTVQLKRTIEEKDRQLQQAQQEVEEQKRTIEQLHEQNQQLYSVKQAETQPPTAVMQQKAIRDMRWQKELAKAPENTIYRGTAASDSNMAYFNSESSNSVHSYDSDTKEWHRLPDTPHTNFTLVIAQCKLTMVGGRVTNSLLSLMGEKDRKWLPHFPAMPTKRWNTAVVCSGNYLIVAGGKNSNTSLATVEVLDTGTRQWFIASSLIHPFTSATISICGERVYMLGGIDQSAAWTHSVLTCTLPELLQSCQPQLLAEKLPTASPNQSTIWRHAADAPHRYSSCATICGQLVAVGGLDKYFKITTTIAVYNERTDSWEVMGHMSIARRLALVAILTGKMMVVGGYESNDVVEMLL